jgi:hypothetical protein
MGAMLPLLTFLLTIVSDWVHRRQPIIIEFLQAENRLLKEGSTASAFGSRTPNECSLRGRLRRWNRKALLEL